MLTFRHYFIAPENLGPRCRRVNEHFTAALSGVELSEMMVTRKRKSPTARSRTRMFSQVSREMAKPRLTASVRAAGNSSLRRRNNVMTLLTRWEPFREFSTMQDRISA